MRKDDTEPDPKSVHLTTRVAATADTITEEAHKGFDLMMVGLRETHDEDGAFNVTVERLAKDFTGLLAILVSNDTDVSPSLNDGLHILVPVNGTLISRNAAEIAFAIARPIGASVTALYVSGGSDSSQRAYFITRLQEEAVLKDIADLGERYKVTVRTALQPRMTTDTAILKMAIAGHGLIIMGVGRRPGEQLYFGNTASAIIKKWKGTALLVAN